MKTKTIGATLKYLREKSGLTQKELVREDSPTERLCDLSHYAKIEQGRKSVGSQLLFQILDRLGVSFAEFEVIQHGGGLQRFKDEFEQLWEIGYKKDYQTVGAMLDALKSKDYCNTDVLSIMQALQLADGVLLSSRDKKHNESLTLLYNALKTTAASVFTERNKLDYEIITSIAFGINEYRIMNMIANVIEILGNHQYATEVSKAIVASLENDSTSRDIKKKLLPSTYFNLSIKILRECDYAGALPIIERGLEFCYSTNEIKVLGKLLWNKGEVIHALHDSIQASSWFEKAYHHSILCGNSSLAKNMKDIALERYNISLG